MRLKTVRRVVMLALGILMAPLIATAQQPAHVPSIGMLSLYAPPSEAERQQSPFLAGLRDLGYIEGQTITIASRYADGQPERLPALAAALVQLQVDLIVAMGGPPVVQAAQEATSIIPIIMAAGGADPVRDGLAASLARPGGNVTGFTILGPELEGKRMELLKGAIPRLSRVAVLWNPANPGIAFYREAIETAGRTLRVTVGPVVEARRVEDLESAFATIAGARPDALAVLADRSLLSHRKRIVEFAAAKRLPVMYPYGEYVDAGGLMSYAPNNAELFRGAATYVDKILKGAKPGNLPVQEPAKFELVINLKTAKTLGLTIPQPLLQRADRLIQ
jgi:ABC-type uncharacterized transport system substrate-binding protein